MSLDKVMKLEDLVEALAEKRARGQSLALSNGAFDLLHVGHVRYLQGAAQLAKLLVVAINSDESVRRLKGSDRPFVPEGERAELVAALQCVDFVCIFDHDDVRPIIRAIKPHVHVKGTDYTLWNVPEREEVEACGGRVAIAGDPKNHSTTAMLQRLYK
jgi:rfaE bifunctional protein nucleotidyltransferase chain/domain